MLEPVALCLAEKHTPPAVCFDSSNKCAGRSNLVLHDKGRAGEAVNSVMAKLVLVGRLLHSFQFQTLGELLNPNDNPACQALVGRKVQVCVLIATPSTIVWRMRFLRMDGPQGWQNVISSSHGLRRRKQGLFDFHTLPPRSVTPAMTDAQYQEMEKLQAKTAEFFARDGV